MRARSLLMTVCFSALILFGLQVLSPPAIASTLTATIDIKPETLNVNMKGRWITAHIKLPEDYNISDIDMSTILLEGLFGAEWSNIEGEKLMVKFDASSIIDYLWGKLYHMGLNRAEITLTVEGQLKSGIPFTGSDTITAINPKIE